MQQTPDFFWWFNTSHLCAQFGLSKDSVLYTYLYILYFLYCLHLIFYYISLTGQSRDYVNSFLFFDSKAQGLLSWLSKCVISLADSNCICAIHGCLWVVVPENTVLCKGTLQGRFKLIWFHYYETHIFFQFLFYFFISCSKTAGTLRHPTAVEDIQSIHHLINFIFLQWK